MRQTCQLLSAHLVDQVPLVAFLHLCRACCLSPCFLAMLRGLYIMLHNQHVMLHHHSITLHNVSHTTGSPTNSSASDVFRLILVRFGGSPFQMDLLQWHCTTM